MQTLLLPVLAAAVALSTLTSPALAQGVPPSTAGSLAAPVDPMQPVGSTRLESRLANGRAAGAGSVQPTISGDGNLLAFSSDARRFIPGEYIKGDHVYLRDPRTDTTTLVDRALNGKPARRGASYDPHLSADGGKVVYYSSRQRLVRGYNDPLDDVYLYDLASGTTTAVSRSLRGGEPNGRSLWPSISADGRYVAYQSAAEDLVQGPGYLGWDIFVFDTVTGQTELISRSPAGGVPDGESSSPAISADGRFVAFDSRATNLVPGDTNGHRDIFRYDRLTGATTLVTRGVDGEPADEYSQLPELSADGELVLYNSEATNLAPGDTNRRFDVFMTDLTTMTTTLVSRALDGESGEGESYEPWVCDDGSTVVFRSGSNDLVPGDRNRFMDVFMYDVSSGTTSLMNRARDGTQADGISFSPVISADCSHVVYSSYAKNLVPGRTYDAAHVYLHRLK